MDRGPNNTGNGSVGPYMALAIIVIGLWVFWMIFT